MKKIVAVSLLSVLFSHLCMAQSVAPQDSFEPNNADIMISVIGLLSLLITIALSYWENKTFKLSHSDYSGKILWTLIVFPAAFMILNIGTFLINLQNNSNFIFDYPSKSVERTFQAINIFVYAGLWFKIRKLVQNFVKSNEKPLKQLVLYLYGYSALSSLIVHVAKMSDDGFKFYYPDQNMGIDLIMELGMLILMYYFSVRKINKLSENISSGKETEKNTGTQPVDISDKLIDLKKLYDAGVIDQEEFEKMKKKVINNQ